MAMIPERWQQIDSLFQAALEREPSERMAFLDDVCTGDEGLRKEIDTLISYDDRPRLLIDEPAFEVAACLFEPDQPELVAGEQIGHYKIMSLIGAGGMGEVYLAQDTRLGRRIALKILPSDYTANAQLVEQFQQEACAASALNHPNILTIHEISQLEGRHFIATEFIEGETLRHRMRRERLSVSEMLDLSIQVARALLAAHQVGVIHCDIKPENIMLRHDGYVKVLDFGLAKLIDRQLTEVIAGKVTTSDSDITPGFLMGTLRYMSPEQAQSQRLDARSDIFSFGVVIYEMIAGTPPFEGKTNSDILVSIINEDPLPLPGCSPGIPAELKRIVTKAMFKDRRQRYQSINDMLADLMGLARGLKPGGAPRPSAHLIPVIGAAIDGVASPAEGGTSDASAIPVQETTVAGHAFVPTIITSMHRHTLRSAFVLFLLFACIAAAAFLKYRSTGTHRAAPRFQKFQVTRLTTDGKSRDAAISANGSRVAYVQETAGQESIWVRQIGTNHLEQIVPDSGVRYAALAFSPDSNHLYYVKYEEKPRQDENGLYRISVSGGASERIIGNVHSPISFSPDGNRFAFFRRNYSPVENALFVAYADGTGEMELARRNKPEHFWDYPCGPAWAPDGKMIACGVQLDDNRLTNIIAVPVKGGAEEVIAVLAQKGLAGPVSGLKWFSDGSGLAAIICKEMTRMFNTEIWSISYPSGEVVKITSDGGGSDYMSLSLTDDSQNLVVTSGTSLESIWVAPRKDLKRIRQITSDAIRYTGLSWTPDGKLIYSVLSHDSGDIWITEPDGIWQKQLTFSEINTQASVSADGRYIVFSSARPGPAIWRMDIDGSNPEQITDAHDAFAPKCSPDGKWVVYLAVHSVWKIPITGGKSVSLADNAADSVFGAAISADGNVIAYYSLEETDANIRVISADSGRLIKRFRLPAKNDDFSGGPEWEQDGRSLTYASTFGGVTNIWRQAMDGGPAKQLTDFKFGTMRRYAWSRDGEQLAFIREQYSRDVVLISTIDQ